VRLLENYSNKAHLSAIAAAIEFSKNLQEAESQFDHGSLIVTMTMGCSEPYKGNDCLQQFPESAS
jgi:hypothetical protein